MNQNEQTICGESLDSGAPEISESIPCLLVMAGPHVGRIYPIRQATTIIGRSSECDVAIKDQTISRAHAQIVIDGGQVILIDLDSTNGTFVNQMPVREQHLREGDKLQLGSTVVVKFTYQDDMERKFQDDLHQSATRDPLTKVFNRGYLLEQIKRDLSHAIRNVRPLSVLICDLDHFKQINDEHSHLAGDEVLRAIASRMVGLLRKEDTLGRYGGEEFIICARDADCDHAWQLAERIRREIETKPVMWNDKPIHVTCSIGIGCVEGAKSMEVTDVIQLADEQLYQAKANGRNQVCPAEGEKPNRTVNSSGTMNGMKPPREIDTEEDLPVELG